MGDVRTAGTRMPLLARDAERAWDDFLGEHAPLILQVVHLFERDRDRIDDCFVFVCEHLRRDGLRRLHRFRDDGAASFPTWLRVVVRNLCLDWRRARFGRPRLPRSIARLPPLDREVFRCLHQRGLSEHETLHVLAPLFPGLTRDAVADSVSRVRRNLNGRQSWFLLTRRPRLVALADGSGDAEAGVLESDIADPGDSPEVAARRSEAKTAIAAALRHLSSRERLLVRLRFEQDLDLEQLARLSGLATPAEAERELHHAVARLRSELAERGLDAVSVKGT